MIFYIIHINPGSEHKESYQSVAYYAERVKKNFFSCGRRYETLQAVKGEAADWNIDAQNPSALLTVKYESRTNEYHAFSLKILNSPHDESYFAFNETNSFVLKEVAFMEENSANVAGCAM